MSGRGRPRTQDVLTPREWEVLDLLRRGLSNREVAEALGISLAGAKFHVSEIIGKLGVSSREEAAAWRPRAARHWGFGVLPGLGGWSEGLPFGLSPKLAAGVVAAALVAIVGVVALRGGGMMPGLATSGIEPTATPVSPCPTPAGAEDLITCVRVLHKELASWTEAESVAPMRLLEPGYIPAGFERKSLTFSYNDPPTAESGWRTDIVSAKFGDAEGRELLINQGLGASLANYAYEQAPDEYRGTLVLGDYEVRWKNGGPIWEERTQPGVGKFGYPTDEWDLSLLGSYTLTWEEPKTGPLAWEKSPDGQVRYFQSGQAFGYLIHGRGLPLEELIKVAESMLTD